MPNKINQYPFKTVTVALFACVILVAGSINWGQEIPPGVEGETIVLPTKTVAPVIYSLVLRPSASSYEFFEFDSVPCNQWTIPEEGVVMGNPLDWNDRYSGAGYPLSNYDTGALSYPDSVVIGTIGGLSYAIPFSVANVDQFWEYAIYKKADGYTQVGGASLSQNCHGYSTGAGYWLNAFGRLIKDDYTKYDLIGDLVPDAFYGDDGHSIKIVEVYFTGDPYKIVTEEKYRDSGVYQREITPCVDYATEVALDLKILIWNGPGTVSTSKSVDPPLDHFYK